MQKILVVSLMLVLTLSGCAEQNKNKQTENSGAPTNRRVVDFERPESKADTSGIVKTIIGNEITILKIEKPERSGNENAENIDDGKKPASGTRSGMGMGGRMKTISSNEDDRLEMLKKMSVGEEKVIIPVGIRMLKREDDKMVEATLSDISSNKMLTIWLDKKITDRKIANFVVINF